VGPHGIHVHDWEVCHRESQITVSSGCPDTFDQIVDINDHPVYLSRSCLYEANALEADNRPTDITARLSQEMTHKTEVDIRSTK
jgi:hypothetical protein